MAGSKSTFLANATLDNFLGSNGSSGLIAPNVLYVALSTLPFIPNYSGGSITEPSISAGYGRVAFQNTPATWPPASGGVKSNAVVFTFPTATGGWGNIWSFYLVDAPTNGNLYWGADLTTPRTVNSGDTASFALNALTITEQ